MNTRYPQTIHVGADLVEKIDRPLDPAIISSRPGGGNTTQSYIKGDIIADKLNEVFGPLGWSKASVIHQMDDWEEEKNGRNGKTTQHVVQVVSNVTLTIKKITADGTDTVFTEQGIGYGEVERGKSRKEAFGMAIKGASTDGLKRCASLVGKAFGMMMASNGSQDDLEYAHNGKASNLRRAQEMRRNAQRGGNDRDDARGGNGRSGDDGRGSGNRGNDRGEQRGGGRDSGTRGDERMRDEPRGGDRGQPRDDQRGRQDDRARPRDDQDAGRQPPRQEQQRQRGGEDGPRQRAGDARPADRDEGARQAPARDEGRAPERQEATPKGEAVPNEAPAEKKAVRKADTNYVLDHPPITKDDMTDFGATLVTRVGEMRQPSDREGLVRQHMNSIKNLDSKIRKRLIERLRELNVDVDKISS